MWHSETMKDLETFTILDFCSLHFSHLLWAQTQAPKGGLSREYATRGDG